MARTEARLRCELWDDEDFRSLSLAAQWLYTAILTQKDLSLCGVLTWTPKRFAKLAATASAAIVRRALDELRSSRYVVLDDGTDELWVRTLIKHDGVLSNHNSLVGMSRAYEAVHSQALREAIAYYVLDLVDEGVLEGVTQGVLEGLSQGVLDGLPEGVRRRLAKPFIKALTLASASARAGAHASPASCLLPPASPGSAGKPQSGDDDTKVNYGTPEQQAVADAVVDEWWRSKTPRPPNSFMGVQKVARRLVASGVEARALRRALDDSPTPTLGALQVALANTSAPTSHNGRILTDRDGPSVGYAPEDD